MSCWREAGLHKGPRWHPGLTHVKRECVEARCGATEESLQDRAQRGDCYSRVMEEKTRLSWTGGDSDLTRTTRGGRNRRRETLERQQEGGAREKNDWWIRERTASQRGGGRKRTDVNCTQIQYNTPVFVYIRPVCVTLISAEVPLLWKTSSHGRKLSNLHDPKVTSDWIWNGYSSVTVMHHLYTT